MPTDPKIFALAILGGFIPSLFWLWFWLKEDKEKPEPKMLIATIFFFGMLSVIVVIPIEKLIEATIKEEMTRTIVWATAEELIKYFAVLILFFKTKKIEKPVDWPVILITSALGFAALENTFFLIEPLSSNQTIVGLLTGHMRFLGSTLLHAVASGVLGIALGLSFYMGRFAKKIYLLMGILLSIALHSTFNFFIIEYGGDNFLKVFGLLWVVTIIVILLFEKLRRMSS